METVNILNMTNMGGMNNMTHMGSMNNMTHMDGMNNMTHMGSMNNMTHMGDMNNMTHMGSMNNMTHMGGMNNMTHMLANSTHPDMNMTNHATHGMDGSASHPTGHEGSGHLSLVHDMKMYFNFDMDIYVLFFNWLISTQAQLAASCVGIFFMSLIYEGLKVLRAYLLIKARPKQRHQENEIDDLKVTSNKKSACCSIFNGFHILQSLLQMLHTTLGMWLMLIYMTFNVWLIISLTLGSGIGYFLFAWKVRVDVGIDEPCH